MARELFARSQKKVISLTRMVSFTTEKLESIWIITII